MTGDEYMIIGILGDNVRERHRERRICESVLQYYDSFSDILEFENETVLFSSRYIVDILILNEGIWKGKFANEEMQIQMKQKGNLIIYIADREEEMQEVFRSWVFGFVLKSRLEEALQAVFCSAVGVVMRTSILENTYKKEVMYIKGERIYTRLVYCDGRQELLRRSLKELEEELEQKGFIKVHRSYLVNMAYIDSINNNELHIGEVIIPIAVRLKSVVHHRYEQYQQQ